MNYLTHATYSVIAQFPGLAARTHRPCGRMGKRLQIIMGSIGAIVILGATAVGGVAVRGFHGGDLGYFPTILLGAVAAFLLLGGIQAVIRARRNPAPPTAANVIPFRRPVAPSRLEAYRDHY